MATHCDASNRHVCSKSCPWCVCNVPRGITTDLQGPHWNGNESCGEYAWVLQSQHAASPWFGCSEPHRSILLDSFQPLPGCSSVPFGYSLSFRRFDMASGTEWLSTLVPLAVASLRSSTSRTCTTRIRSGNHLNGHPRSRNEWHHRFPLQ